MADGLMEAEAKRHMRNSPATEKQQEELRLEEKIDILIIQNGRILEIMEAVSGALAQVQNHPMLGQFIGTPGR